MGNDIQINEILTFSGKKKVLQPDVRRYDFIWHFMPNKTRYYGFYQLSVDATRHLCRSFLTLWVKSENEYKWRQPGLSACDSTVFMHLFFIIFCRRSSPFLYKCSFFIRSVIMGNILTCIFSQKKGYFISLYLCMVADLVLYFTYYLLLFIIFFLLFFSLYHVKYQDSTPYPPT